MRPLQDQCEPTAYADLERMFQSDIGVSIPEYFDEFDPNPIGVASLAQVHVGRLKGSGERVAVKLQHPHLQEFCEIDMEMVEVSLGALPTSSSGVMKETVGLTHGIFAHIHRVDQALVPGVRVYVAGRGDARELAEGDGLRA